jgi:hypothetical protein
LVSGNFERKLVPRWYPDRGEEATSATSQTLLPESPEEEREQCEQIASYLKTRYGSQKQQGDPSLQSQPLKGLSVDSLPFRMAAEFTSLNPSVLLREARGKKPVTSTDSTRKDLYLVKVKVSSVYHHMSSYHLSSGYCC